MCLISTISYLIWQFIRTRYTVLICVCLVYMHCLSVFHCLQSKGVLKDVLLANKRAREEFLNLLTSTEEYLQPFPEKCKELIEEACPEYEETLHKLRRTLDKKDDCKLLIAGIIT